MIIPNLGLGGAEIMVETLAYALKERNHQVKIISLYDHKTVIGERLFNNNIEVVYLDKRKGFDLNIIKQLNDLFKMDTPDIIHTHLSVMKYVIPAANRRGIKNIIHTVHSIANKEFGYIDRLLHKILYKRKKVTPVAISEVIQKTIKLEYKIELREIPVVYNGVNLERCIVKENYDKPVETIINVASFKEAKNHRQLLDVFKQINADYPKIQLFLVGDGTKIQEIKSYVKELGIQDKVIFTGNISNVFTLLNKADIFLLTSKWEGMPISLIEAQGSGLPIVSTNVGGIPDMITNEESGLLVDLKTINIINAVKKLINNPELRMKFGKNAKIKSNEFSDKIMVEKYTEIYVKVIERNK